MVSKFAFFILFLCLISGVNAQNIQIYPVQLSDPKDFGGRVNCIMQDKTGFIWIGKETGLFRYDGHELKSFRSDPSDSSSIGGNNILTIAGDSTGNLWIGTKGSGLNYYNRNTGKFSHYIHDEKDPASISYNEVYTIKPDGKGNFWIGTDGGGVNFFDPKTGKFQSFRHLQGDSLGLQSNKILRINDAADGNYWLGTWGGGLHLLNPRTQKIRHLGDGTPFSKANVYCAKEVSPGFLWLATWGQGLVACDIQSERFRTIIDPAIIPNIRDIQIDSKGNIWVGTSTGLLRFASHKSDYQVIHGGSANFDNISHLFIDRTQSVWLGCENGTVGKINSVQKKFSVVPANLPFCSLPVQTMLTEKATGQIWFAAGSSLIRFDPLTKQFKSYPSHYTGFISMTGMTGGKSILCATNAGLTVFDKASGGFRDLNFVKNSPADLLNRQIWTLSATDSSCYWIGALGVAYQIRYDEKASRWNILKVLYSGANEPLSVSHYPSCFLNDSNGNFWIGTWGGGLNLLKSGSAQFVPLVHETSNPKSLSDNFVECLLKSKSNQVLVGTHSGLNIYDQGSVSFRNVTVKDGLTSDWIDALITDSKNRIWLSTPKGISSVSADGKTIKNYDFNDGLPANAFLARSVTTDLMGNLYFGSVRGLVWFHPDSITSNPFLPEAVIVDLKVNDKSLTILESSPLKGSIEMAKEIQLDDSQSSFAVQMGALGYFNPSRNRIKYQLKGYDSDWKMAGADQTAVYSAISPGKYEFRMLVSNEDGIWNPNAKSINIVINKPLWMTGGAIFFYLILISGFVLLFHFKRRNLNFVLNEVVGDSKLKKSSNHDLIQPSNVIAEPAETEFLKKAILFVEENIADPDFGVEQLCDKLCLSRAQVYRKINSVAGLSVTEFVKEIRLKRAAQLILQKPASISEVAYLVGFNDPKYFSKCFKQQFGVSPIHYPQSKSFNSSEPS